MLPQPQYLDGVALGHLAAWAEGQSSRSRQFSSLGVEQPRVTVVATFEADGLKLGDRYRVDLKVIIEERENAVLIPEAALFRSGGEWRAFRIEDGRAQMVTVKTDIRDGRKREVLEGLAEGDRISSIPTQHWRMAPASRPSPSEVYQPGPDGAFAWMRLLLTEVKTQTQQLCARHSEASFPVRAGARITSAYVAHPIDNCHTRELSDLPARSRSIPRGS